MSEETTAQETDEHATGDQPTGDPDGLSPEEVEEVRQERLDPENRPENVEIDNTPREFDAQKGLFTDSEGYDDAPVRFPPVSEQGT